MMMDTKDNTIDEWVSCICIIIILGCIMANTLWSDSQRTKLSERISDNYIMISDLKWEVIDLKKQLQREINMNAIYEEMLIDGYYKTETFGR